jgi:alkylhydroperoxidase/carboxymuconolactone decarboxylase family protein YurZ
VSLSAVSWETHRALAGISAGRADAVGDADGLGARSSALVRIAALIALDAPPASYARQVADAQEAGVDAEEILGVLHAIAPEVGGPRVVAAAPEIMLALGLSLPSETE